MLTNRRERWELFDVGVGIQTQLLAIPTFTLPNPTTRQQLIFDQAKYDSLKLEEKAAVDKVSGEAATRMFASGWNCTDAASREIQKQTSVQRQVANESFINEIKAKQAVLEDKWVAAAEARGLKNARAMLDEFRADTTKVK